MKNILELQNLTKSYGSKSAIDGVDLAVGEAACFGLLGPNGAGKSTIMKIITGVTDPDQGTLHLFGLNGAKSRKGISEKIGYVPQDITVYEKLNALDNLTFFGELYGLRGTELKKRIGDVLESVGLADRAKDPVGTYSGGMKRRINMAAALLHRPKLLILDEPTVGVDPQSRNHIFEMIKTLRSQGVTVIYSTHYMEEIEALCSDIAIMDKGKVIAQGTLAGLTEQYGGSMIYLEAEAIQTKPAFISADSIHARGKGWIIGSRNLLKTLKEITEKAVSDNIPVKELGIVHPSLETIFLKLTGTALRD